MTANDIDWEIEDPSYIFSILCSIYEGGNMGTLTTEDIDKLEDIIKIDETYSFVYAYTIKKGRFIKGEESIKNNAYISYKYAKDVIKGRFEKAEVTLLKSPNKELRESYLDLLSKDKK
jgi:hypothetical protein